MLTIPKLFTSKDQFDEIKKKPEGDGTYTVPVYKVITFLKRFDLFRVETGKYGIISLRENEV